IRFLQEKSSVHDKHFSTMRAVATVALFLLSTTSTRVTFPFSEVLQAPDIVKLNYSNFHCINPCSAYVDRKSDKLMITQNGKVVATFDAIFRMAPAGILLPAGDYKLENKGEANPEFVLYVVDSTVPNYGSPVYAPQKAQGVAVKSTARYATVLSSFEAVWFSSFTGSFPDGYPRIYGTGFDEAGGASCYPAYQARSPSNAAKSWPTIASAVLTVDFGFVGDHNVSINDGTINNPPKSAGMSTVYTSPGYIGCSFTAGQNYYSKLTQVQDKFTLTAESLDVDAWCNGISAAEPVQLTINNNKVDLVGSKTHSEHYERGNFDVSLSWVRQTPESSFAIQLDFGSTNDKPLTTTTLTPSTISSGRSLSLFSALAMVILACV
ncbi:hypothetical protein PENTCL1PPCAC_19347, partial [Pristionchus entomophagus]